MVISDFYERFNFFFRKFCLTPVFAMFSFIFLRGKLARGCQKCCTLARPLTAVLGLTGHRGNVFS